MSSLFTQDALELLVVISAPVGLLALFFQVWIARKQFPKASLVTVALSVASCLWAIRTLHNRNSKPEPETNSKLLAGIGSKLNFMEQDISSLKATRTQTAPPVVMVPDSQPTSFDQPDAQGQDDAAAEENSSLNSTDQPPIVTQDDSEDNFAEESRKMAALLVDSQRRLKEAENRKPLRVASAPEEAKLTVPAAFKFTPVKEYEVHDYEFHTITLSPPKRKPWPPWCIVKACY